MKELNFSIEKKIEYIFHKPRVCILVIGIFSLLLRLFYLPTNIPLTFDGLLYFSYATDTSILGHFPQGYLTSNNGWPAFLSLFFALFHYSNFLDYMLIQRLVSVCLSTLTIIPVYLLCRRFFGVRYSLIGATLFGFDPRIIQNSMLGITEPLFIILVTFSLYLVLSNNIRIIYIAFAIAALATIIRYEGALTFFVLSVIFFVSHKKSKGTIAKYLLAVTIFVVILLPMTILRLHDTGQDGIASHIVAGAEVSFLLTNDKENQTLALILFVINGFVNLMKYLGWIMIPVFVFFVPLGFFLMIKERRGRLFMILSIVVLLIPSLYAYSRGYQETRYLYTVYPIFCILSLFTIQRFVERFDTKNIVLILIISGIVFSSSAFFIIKDTNTTHDQESFDISKKITEIAIGINDFTPEDSYLTVANFPEKWPMLRSDMHEKTIIIPTTGFNSLTEFIKDSKNKGLTHLITDDRVNRPEFIKDVFHNEKDYDYLEKIFDSSEHGYSYHVKIFRINYDKFNTKIIQDIR